MKCEECSVFISLTSPSYWLDVGNRTVMFCSYKCRKKYLARKVYEKKLKCIGEVKNKLKR